MPLRGSSRFQQRRMTLPPFTVYLSSLLSEGGELSKNYQKIDIKVPMRPPWRQLEYRHRFRVETAIFRAFLAKNSGFDHFWGNFRVKISNFTVIRVKTGDKHYHQDVPIAQSILKRYHTSSNSKNLPFQRKNSARNRPLKLLSKKYCKNRKLVAIFRFIYNI